MPTHPQTDPQRLLVVKLADIGDALTITPALGALRRAHPAATLHVLTTPGGAAVLRDLALHDGVIVFPKQRFDRLGGLVRPASLAAAARLWRQLRSGGYDTVLLLHHLTTRFGRLKYRALVAATGAPTVLGLDNGHGTFLTAHVADRGFGAQHESDYWLAVAVLAGAAPTGQLQAPVAPYPLPAAALRIALHPGSGGFAPARRWPVARWAAVAAVLLAEGAQVILVGGPEEAALRQQLIAQLPDRAGLVDLGGRTSLPELGDVLRQSQLFLGGDSGVLHLAAAVGTPVVAPYGPTDPRAWGPWSGQPWHTAQALPHGVTVLSNGPHTALHAPLACSPCIYRGFALGQPAGCPDRTCLERITVVDVLAAIRQQLEATHAA